MIEAFSPEHPINHPTEETLLETIFVGITAAATMYTALERFLTKRHCLTVEGAGYIPQADYAQVRVTISANSATYIRAVECKGRRISAVASDQRVKRLACGMRFGTKNHRETMVNFYISPLPADGEPIVLKFDTGLRFFPQTVELWPSDFTAQVTPTRKWPTHRPATSASEEES